MSSPSAIDALIDSLQTNRMPGCVLLLTSDLDTRSVLQAAERKEVTDVQWVGGDTWGSRDYVSQGQRGHHWVLSPYSLRRVKPQGSGITIPACFHTITKEPLAPEVTYVVNAVKALATGLHNAITELCPGVTNHLCSNFRNNPDSFYDIVRTVSFTGADGVNFQFDSKGDGPAEYDILNFRPTEDGRLAHATIGTWIDGILTLTTPDLYRGGEKIMLPESQRVASGDVTNVSLCRNQRGWWPVCPESSRFQPLWAYTNPIPVHRRHAEVFEKLGSSMWRPYCMQ
ncbi:hypothetical protein BSL78_01207 [Apostichopus japonicus]|uniref:Receptor ligand binding region domain-containing protein n=1 Tax=Stichopus japonicus TaxID=307972 RepID=A0A2G8LNN8_STIJA|nr:hypothetical protein BSL78_01207 [Apostichopus japonicus]